jgi:hypothetical protein
VAATHRHNMLLPSLLAPIYQVATVRRRGQNHPSQTAAHAAHYACGFGGSGSSCARDVKITCIQSKEWRET